MGSGRSFAPTARRARQSAISLGTALRNGNIRRAELAWAVAIGAEWAHLVTLGVFAYDQGGTALVGLAGLVRLLPAGIVAPFASALGDRARREHLLLALVLLEALALGGSGAAALAGDRVGVLVLAAVIGVTSTLVRPTIGSVLPSLARSPAELVASNAATSVFEGLGALCGPLVVGATVRVAGTGSVFLVTGAVMALAATLLVGLRIPRRVPIDEGVPSTEGPGGQGGPAPSQAVGARLRKALKAGAAGLHLVATDRSLRLLVGMAGGQCFVRGCLNVLVVVTAFDLVHGGSSAVGYLNAALGVGGLLGAFGAMTLSTKRLGLTFGLAILCWGAPIALLAAVGLLPLALLCLAGVGVANAVEDVALVTLLQRSAPDELLSSVLGVLWGTAMASVALGSVVPAALVTALGDRMTLLVVGLVLPVLALGSSSRLLRTDRDARPSRRLDLVEKVPMFGPLSLAAKERLARALVPMPVGAGVLVLEEGHAGDRFFIVDEGRFSVERAGERVAEIGPGGYFGEIALVHDVPRTASVKAEGSSMLYALGRSAFLTAISGHPDATAAAHRISEERAAPAGGSV